MSQKMKILLVTVAIFVAVEARAQNWENVYNNPGFGNGRGNSHGHGPPWSYLLRQDYLQNIALGSNVEWVCRNSKTNDMMIIASDNTQQTPTRGAWWQWQNLPPGHNRHQEDGHHWVQPIIVIQQGTQDGNNEGGNQTPWPNISPETYNNDNKPQTTTPQYHGGEGLIDIRLGTDKANR